MRIAEATLREVQNQMDAVAVVGEYLRLDKRSGRYWGCCPFHNEKTPSFTVDPERKLYYCFGCHKGGSIIDFVMEMDKTSFPETIETLAKKLGIEVAYEGAARDQTQEREAAARQEALYELYRRVAGSFNHLLREETQGAFARNYILGRGISEAMIEKFRLGYAPADRSWLFQFLSRRGYSPEFLASSGLFTAKYPESAFFSHRLMFPIADRQGRTVAFGARLLAEEGPKYLNSQESAIYKKGQTLFAIDLAVPEIRRTRAVYIAEGYLDVIALHQAEITNAAAPLGTAFTDDQAKLLRHWADQVYLIFDADEAGQAAAVKAILTCRKNGLACSVVVPGRGIGHNGEGAVFLKDPADILKEAGPEALQKSTKCCINDFEYLIDRARSLFDASQSGGKAQGVAFLFPYVETLDSEVSRDACIGDLADAFGAERQAVLADFNRYTTGREARGSSSRGFSLPEAPPAVRKNGELYLLTAVLVNHTLFPRLRRILSIEELDDPQAKELFIALEEWYRNDAPGEGEAIPHDLLSRINNAALRNFVIEQAASNAFVLEPEVLFESVKQVVTRKRLTRRQAEIIMELRTQKRRDPGGSLDDLLVEKVHVDADLRRLKEANE
jgi:DNA primase